MLMDVEFRGLRGDFTLSRNLKKEEKERSKQVTPVTKIPQPDLD